MVKSKLFIIWGIGLILFLLICLLAIERTEFDLQFVVEPNQYTNTLNIETVNINGYLITFLKNNYYINGSVLIGDKDFTITAYENNSTMKNTKTKQENEEYEIYNMYIEALRDHPVSDWDKTLNGWITIYGNITEGIDVISVTVETRPELSRSSSYETFSAFPF